MSEWRLGEEFNSGWPLRHGDHFVGWIGGDQSDRDDLMAALTTERAQLAAAQAQVARLRAALTAALEQTDDGLHSSPCDEPDCWVEMARAALAPGEPSAEPSTEE